MRSLGGIYETAANPCVPDTDGSRGDLRRLPTWSHLAAIRDGAIPQPTIRPNGIFRRRSRFDPWRDLESIRNATYWPMKL